VKVTEQQAWGMGREVRESEQMLSRRISRQPNYFTEGRKENGVEDPVFRYLCFLL
jgi:hypothetical protein